MPRIVAGFDKLEGLRLEIFTIDEIREIDYATMDVLSTIGVYVSDPEAREVYKRASCEVDEKTKVVKIPEYLVRECVSKCPSQYLLAGREKKHDFVMKVGKEVGVTTFGTGLYVYDFEKKDIRESTLKDVADSAKVADWCEHIDVYSLAIAARDLIKEGRPADLYETLASWENTTKHFHHIDPVGEHMEAYFKMMVAYYGGDEEMARRRPIISALLCPTSPLQLHDNACKVIMKGAEYGIPVNVLSMAMSGATAPVTLAGTLVTHNAEVLAGIVLAQLVRPGAPVMYGSSTTMFDLRTVTAPVGAPELGLISAAVAKLGQYYKLPTYVAGV
jgi:trimethylamine--corrinoid protein Co-methyltransferase